MAEQAPPKASGPESASRPPARGGEPGARPIEFVVPGELATRTGGYGYDRRIVAALRASGRDVRVHELAGDWPWPDEATRSAAGRC